MKIITLATCHNRKQKTLNTLSALESQKLPDSVEVEHVLVNDGSSDGTESAVRDLFPKVEIVNGTGELYWAGGMREGWERAVRRKKFDYLFVYNDDVSLADDALSRLLSSSADFVADGGVAQHAVVGAFCDANKLETTYGGQVRNSWWNRLRFRRADPPASGYIKVDTMNMNGALISCAALEKVGFLSGYFRHGGADFEFGLKLSEHGGQVILSSGYIGVCERNEKLDNYIAYSSSLAACYRSTFEVKKGTPRERFLLIYHHGGILWPLLLIVPYITIPYHYYKMNLIRR